MILLQNSDWNEYELLDTGSGQRLERFGKYILVRPDPQAIWQPTLQQSQWNNANAIFAKDENCKEKWSIQTSVPEKWMLSYKNLRFYCKLSSFKHTGVFPEQTAQWDWITNLIDKQNANNNPVNILNLFAYTGIASLAAAAAGASVTHLDASRSTIGWARENQQASGLTDKPVRWILDDAIKFTAREIKRGVHYDGIIMDPPVYGHGPRGEIWDFHKDMPTLLKNCKQILSDNPLFIIINAYAISSSALMLQNLLIDMTKGLGGIIEFGELTLKETYGKRLLSTGIFGRWEKMNLDTKKPQSL